MGAGAPAPAYQPTSSGTGVVLVVLRSVSIPILGFWRPENGAAGVGKGGGVMSRPFPFSIPPAAKPVLDALLQAQALYERACELWGEYLAQLPESEKLQHLVPFPCPDKEFRDWWLYDSQDSGEGPC